MTSTFYARLVVPRQVAIGAMGGQPIYLDCLDCGATDSVIEGVELDQQYRIVRYPRPHGLYAHAAFCQRCFNRRWSETEQTGQLMVVTLP